MKRKILVTGATGFIGRKLVPELAKKHEVICFVRKTSKIKELEKLKVKFAFGDMLDRSSVSRALKDISIVIHLATSHLQGNEKLNIKGTRIIIEECKKNRIKRLVFISSMATKRRTLDDYGRAKKEIEKIVENSGVDYTILRPSIIYSRKNLSLIGKSISFPFVIPVIGNGRYKINPVHIDDVVKAICKAIDSKKATNKGYDVAGGENISFNEIIRICKEKFKIRKIAIHVPISLCLLIFRFFPIISLDAIRGINEDSNADTKGLEKDLRIKTISFREGIKTK